MFITSCIHGSPDSPPNGLVISTLHLNSPVVPASLPNYIGLLLWSCCFNLEPKVRALPTQCSWGHSQWYSGLSLASQLSRASSISSHWSLNPIITLLSQCLSSPSQCSSGLSLSFQRLNFQWPWYSFVTCWKSSRKTSTMSCQQYTSIIVSVLVLASPGPCSCPLPCAVSISVLDLIWFRTSDSLTLVLLRTQSLSNF